MPAHVEMKNRKEMQTSSGHPSVKIPVRVPVDGLNPLRGFIWVFLGARHQKRGVEIIVRANHKSKNKDYKKESKRNENINEI